MKSCRDGFGDGLIQVGRLHKKVVLVGADLNSATRAAGFAEAYPTRSFDVGIQEANAIGICAGLAAQGLRPVFSSFASFLTGRYDTIRCSIALPNVPVILVGTHSGLSPSMDGPTQSAYEDINIMRGLPNFDVCQPCCYEETLGLIMAVCSVPTLKRSVYIRVGRQPVRHKCVNNFNQPFTLEYASAQKTNKIIFSSGCLIDTALEVGKALDIPVVNILKLKPFELPTEYLEGVETIYTIEDHSIIGGLGAAVSEVSSIKVKRFGIPDVFPSSGDPTLLYRKYGLDSESIINEIHSEH